MASSQRRNRNRFKTTSSCDGYSCITGYFLSLVDTRDDDADTDDEEDTDIDDGELNADVSDENVFSGSALNASSKELKKLTVNFKDCKSGKVLQLTGHFPLSDPWWCATLYVNSKKEVVSGPSYTLHSDNGVMSENHVLLLMLKCGVKSDQAEKFLNALRQQSLEKSLSFDTMDRYLEQIFKIKKPTKEMTDIYLRMRSGPAILARRALKFVDLFRLLPRLLPRQFEQLVLNMDDDKLSAVETCLLTEPWIFGFSCLVSRRFGINNCEASLRAFYVSDIINSVANPQRDALHVYDELKTFCRVKGHTYVRIPELKALCTTRDFEIENWTAVREFLKDHQITVEEKKPNARSHVYLSMYWSAEKNVANFFCKLKKLHQAEPWKFQIDFNRQLFAKIRTDPDQVKAAELIASEPIVVLSGKGGCGKTEVVSCVFKFMIELMEFERDSSVDEDAMIDAVIAYENSLTASTVVEVDNEWSDESCLFPDVDETDVAIHLPYTNGVELTVFEQAATDVQSIEKQLLDNAASDEHGISVAVSLAECPRDVCAKDNRVECPEILLVAPTGKAAQLLGRRTGLPAFTLHSVILSYRNWRRRDVDYEYKFRDVRALVVDEGSLVAVRTFYGLIDSLPRLQKVVILGDIQQLPSIEPGCFLRDLFSEMAKHGCTVELRTNHRAESQCIIDNASRITRQVYPIADSQKHFHIIELSESDESPSNARDRTVRKVLEGNLLIDDKTSQFIAFRRSDCQAINEICCQHYVKHPIKSCKKKNLFCIGDKICCTKNARISLISDLNDATNSKNVAQDKMFCNGEIFFIGDWHEVQEKGTTTITVTLFEPQLKVNYRVDWKNLNAMCKMRHAWARTIHTFQGSEASTIIYVVGSAWNQTWQHVYTAVTRGRGAVIIIALKSMLEQAIRNKPTPRNTSLKDKLDVLFQSLDVVKNSETDDDCTSKFELTSENLPDGNCDSSGHNSQVFDEKNQSFFVDQHTLFGPEKCIDELPYPDGFELPSSFDLVCNVRESSTWSGNYGDSNDVSLEDATSEQLASDVSISVCDVVEQDGVSATEPYDATVCEFSEWNESMDHAVNVTMMEECRRFSSVPEIDFASNNNSMSSSFEYGAAKHSPVGNAANIVTSAGALMSSPKPGVAQNQLCTPKRALGCRDRDEMSEPPALRQRLEDNDTGVSPLRHSLSSRLNLS